MQGRSEGGARGYRVPRPGLLQGAPLFQTQRGLVFVVTCLLLVLIFRPAQEIFYRHRERNQQVAEFDLQKKRSPPLNRSVYGCFTLRCQQFKPRFFSGIIFRVYQILVKGGPELMLVPVPDCFLNGPVSRVE